jgi:dihydrolipoamide dehydrogenase
VRGYAHFLDDRTLQVGDAQRVTFAQAVIATGSSPSIPPMLRAAGERLIVNDDVFAWDDLPRAVAVFGPGVIGLELGQALHRLGVEVHLFGRGGPVGPLTDPQVRDYAAQTLRSEFYLDADASIDRIESTADGVVIAFTDLAGHARALRVDYVIAAAGRTPNVRGLKLEHTSLQLDKLGVPVFDPRTLRCGDSHIFIAGDVNNALPLLHEAADEGSIAGENAARFPAVRPGLRRAPLAVVFTDPQLAMVGARYADLDAAQPRPAACLCRARYRALPRRRDDRTGSGAHRSSAGMGAAVPAYDRAHAGDAVLSPSGGRGVAHCAARCSEKAHAVLSQGGARRSLV